MQGFIDVMKNHGWKIREIKRKNKFECNIIIEEMSIQRLLSRGNITIKSSCQESKTRDSSS